VSVADYLSLVRIPLGVAFVLVAGDTLLAMTVLAMAGLSDVLDGWVARRQRAHGASDEASHPGVNDRRHHRGDWLDPLCDKLFVGAVVAGLYLARQPPVLWLVLLLTRESLQLVAVTALRLVPTLHRLSRDFDYRAHPIGKATTVVQFLAAAALLLGHPLAGPAVWASAALGVMSVFTYVRRLGVHPKWVN
jgi:cardiolipin synthase (CMP-forming)